MSSDVFVKKPLALALQTAMGEPSAEAEAFVAAPADPSGRRQRLRLWELSPKLHCPVIGTCLTPRELARIARRHNLEHDARDAYALHVQAVGWASARSGASRDLQRYLDAKYAADIERFAAARDAPAVLALWKAHWQQGKVAGAMWAALTHPLADEPTRQAVYADVHMLSHQLGAAQAADARRLHALLRENEALAALLAASRAETGAAQARAQQASDELQHCRQELTAARQAQAQLAARLAQFESGQALVDLGRRVRELTAVNDELRAVAERVPMLHAELAQARERIAQLARQCDQLAAARDALERLLASEDDRCADTCPAGASNAARSVLCVGGRTAQLPYYRQLAQRLGLELLHHDGGREQALSRLPELVAAADAVLCPTDCVSHGAYYLLKRCCKRSGKPCLLFRGAGVSSFAIALTQVAAGRVTVGTAPRRES
ncbi:MAG TPA: DUF2325 domain-containing protein [Burkholderiaceae bacterium]|jgi:hypothetical protein|nr:DUF2325 domain-containing protein [Burkholderiaceae bacterium]